MTTIRQLRDMRPEAVALYMTFAASDNERAAWRVYVAECSMINNEYLLALDLIDADGEELDMEIGRLMSIRGGKQKAAYAKMLDDAFGKQS